MKSVKLIVTEKHYIDGSFNEREFMYKCYETMTDKELNDCVVEIYRWHNSIHIYNTREVVRVVRVETGKGNWRTKRKI